MKPKLTAAQNLALKGLNLKEKLTLLHLWKRKGEVSQEAFNFLTNKWINKESKKLMGLDNPLSRKNNENAERLCRCKSVVETEMKNFLSRLRNILNEYLANRSKEAALLSDDELAKFQNFLAQHFSYRGLINRLVIVGLRFPDKRLNKLCEEFIVKNRKHSHFQDFTFWGLLWEDCNLVPLDAVRLMLVEKDGHYAIDSCFDPLLIKGLIPLIEFQRDKEIQRLQWAMTLDGEELEREVVRKSKRLEAFNMLLKAAAEYTN